jgi:hypothetical protein
MLRFFMLSVTFFIATLSVFMLNVVLLSVVAPLWRHFQGQTKTK